MDTILQRLPRAEFPLYDRVVVLVVVVAVDLFEASFDEA